MKKLLALVLALVMTLGLATVGTNAATWSDLKDTDKVAADREEAFKVLNSIQIFEGDENNNLNPDAQLTRAEAAKIIATLNLGKTAADNLSGNGGKFSDVPASNWASGYIEYCASTGIIAGRGDGTFDPAGSLTFAAFSKMLLVSLGYVAEVEELVGGEWEFNVARIATTIDLYKGMDTPASKEIVKRADAAQMAFNVLKTPMVTYAYNGTNLLTNISAVGKTAAVYETTAARDTQTISTATVNDGSARGTYMVEFAERHFPKLTRNSHDVDDWGRPCTTWTNNRVEIGKFENSDLLVYTTDEAVKGSKIYEVLGGSTLLSRYANDLTRASIVYNVYVDGVPLSANTAPTKASVVERIVSNGAKLGISGAGTELSVYIDDDSYYNYGVTTTDTAKVPVVTIVVRNTWLAEVLADYNTTDKNVLLGVYTADDAPESRWAKAANVAADLTGYKEGDWVLIKFTRDDNVVREVKDPEIVKGAYISAYTVDAGMDTVTVDGTDEYGVASTAHTDASILNVYTKRELKGFTYDLYTDGKAEHLYGIQYASKDTSLVFVVGFEVASSALAASTARASMIFPDGTWNTTTVALSANANHTARTAINALMDANGKNSAVNAWFTYAKADDGTITLIDMIPSSTDASAQAANADYHQYSVLMDNTFDTTPDIDASHTTLKYVDAKKNNLYAIGSDNSVYIAAVADTSVNYNGKLGAIVKTNGVSKGVKNASFLGSNLKAYDDNGVARDLTAFKTRTAIGTVSFGEAYSNAYFVYDTNNYVVAAVVLTDKTNADHLMYVTDTVSLRQYVAGVGYVDTYTAIIDGKTEEVEIKVDSLKAGYDTNGKLVPGTLYKIAYDSTGEYVIVADPATNTLAQLKTELNKQRGFAVTGVMTNGNYIQLGDKVNKRTTNMLYVNDALNANQGYVQANATGNFWVTRDGGDTYTRYNTPSAAYAAATAKDNKGNIYTVTSAYAICDKGTGFATTMVFVAATGAGTGNVVVAGNVVTALGTANGTSYKASTAKVSNATILRNGNMRATVTYTAPLYANTKDTVSFTVDIYDGNNNLVGSVNSGALTAGEDGKYVFNLADNTGVYSTDDVLTFKITNEKISSVKVRYFLGSVADGNEITSKMTTTPAGTTTAALDVTGTTGATAAAISSQFAATVAAAAAATAKIENATASAAGEANYNGTATNNFNTGAIASSQTWLADGGDYVNVIYGATGPAVAPTYAITTDTAALLAGAGVALQTLNGDTSAEKAKALILDAAVGALAGNAKGNTVRLEAKLGAVFASATTYGLEVTVPLKGDDGTIINLTGTIVAPATTAVTLTGDVPMTQNWKVQESSIVTNVVTKLVLKDTTATANANTSVAHKAGEFTYTIKFDREIVSTNANGLIVIGTDVTMTDASTTNAILSAVIDGDTIVVTLAHELAAGDDLGLAAGKFADAAYAANTNTAATLTYTGVADTAGWTLT